MGSSTYALGDPLKGGFTKGGSEWTPTRKTNIQVLSPEEGGKKRNVNIEGGSWRGTMQITSKEEEIQAERSPENPKRYVSLRRSNKNKGFIKGHSVKSRARKRGRQLQRRSQISLKNSRPSLKRMRVVVLRGRRCFFVKRDPGLTC